MMSPKSSLLATALLATCLSCGCSFYNDEEQAEYDRVYAATSEVLQKYFNVRESQFVEGHMIAYSQISNQFGEQQRYKVDASIHRDGEGFFFPEVQVLNEWNMSIANAGKNSRGQTNPDWRAAGFNRKLETQLLNEINTRIGRSSDSVNADYFNSDLELIERQKQIDAARAGYEASEQTNK